MKYAVDHYELGREQEISAESLLSHPYIRRKKDRFFCPECGERVFFRAKGDGEFYHQKQVEGVTPECDKRVDGRSGLSLYERMGLSLYIVHDSGERYCLGISFPPLGEQTLKVAAQQKASVRISARGQESKFWVKRELFFAGHSTLLPVDFLPPAERNYTIEVLNAGGIAGIRQRWPNYADGFGAGGALFHYNAESGRKIRHGDSVSLGKQYYLVTNQTYSPPYPEMQVNQVGFIRLKNRYLAVSKMTVNVSTKDATRYSLVNSYLRSMFGVWLLETAPELTPLWPPTVLQQDAQVPVVPTAQKLYCAVSSGNDVPNVYSYGVSVPRQINVEKDGVILPLYGPETAASVDRKYVGREVFYRRGPRPSHDFSCAVNLKDSNGNPLDWEALTQTSLAAVSSIEANAKMGLVVGCKGHIYQHVAIRADNTPMPILKYPQEVYLVIEENRNYSIFFYCHAKETVRAARLDKADLLDTLKKYLHGPLVPTPAWVAWIVRDCGKKRNIPLARFICEEVRGGKIPLELLRALFTMKEVMIKEDSR